VASFEAYYFTNEIRIPGRPTVRIPFDYPVEMERFNEPRVCSRVRQGRVQHDHENCGEHLLPRRSELVRGLGDRVGCFATLTGLAGRPRQSSDALRGFERRLKNFNASEENQAC